MAGKYGVIDIGTNSARLMLAMVLEDETIRVREKRLIPCRIGEGMNSKGVYLTEDAVQRALDAIANFIYICEKMEVDQVYIFATSAVRSAYNQEEFLEKCKQRFGIEIDVISGELEAVVDFLGVFGNWGTGRVIDIGGGSTEILAGADGRVNIAGSVEMGCVRAAQMLPDVAAGHIQTRKLFRKSPAVIAERKKGKRELVTSMKTCKTLMSKIKKQVGPVYAVGGTATTLAALALGLETAYDSNLVHGHMLRHEEIRRILSRIGPMPMKDRVQIPILKDRADVFCFGANMLLTFMDDIGVSSVICSDRDNLEGYLTYRLQQKKI